MSRASARLKSLAAIHKLRALSERRALAQVLRSEGERLAAAAERERQAQRLLDEVQGWDRALGVAAIDPQQLGNWSCAVSDQRARDRMAEIDLDRRTRDVDAAKRAHAIETGRRDVSSSLLRAARRRHGAQREERALAELSDRWTGAKGR
jgi:hypothetical protein